MIRSRGLRGAVTVVASLALLAGVAGPSVGAQSQQPRKPVSLHDREGPPDIDRRRGQIEPSSRQESIVEAEGLTVRWNEFGTPHSLIQHGGFLATGLPSDPVDAARTWLQQNRSLFRLSSGGVESLELVRNAPLGPGRAVLLRQRFDDLSASAGGLISLAVSDGRIAYVSSSITGDESVSGAVRLSPQDAVVAAAADVGLDIEGDLGQPRRVGEWTRIDVRGFTNPASARLVALPTVRDGTIRAYQTFIFDNARADGPAAFTHHIDAATGEVLVRVNEVESAGEPKWDLFPAYPELDGSSTDTRETWCWEDAPGCDRVIAQDPGATPLAWDVDPTTGTSTETSLGNNARSYEFWHQPNPFTVGTTPATSRPGRDYQYDWTNQWFEEGCNPSVFTSPQRNDIDAAIANLFAGHNRMHDWSYRLGFTEQTWNAQVSNFGRGEDEDDPEQGNAQAGAITGFRDNANQITPPDGQAPITNMYLWQSIAGAFYAPCVDGDFDMTVIGHEYTHMISNRMVAGPDERLRGLQANAMGESWSDLMAMEILNEYGDIPIAGESPYAIGAYVTGDPVAGIRNYNMSDSPLNYSDVGYDLVGPQVHADGEIWSATNFDIRAAMIDRYGAGNAALQRRCADGELAADGCPGNRRWVQLVFDAWLLVPSETTMLDARDAMLASDVVRFGGANQDLLWNAFAARGMGQNASSDGVNDSDPVPSFESPFADEAVVTFTPAGEGTAGAVAELYVGDYEARATPIADTDPSTPLGDTFRIVPGTYELMVRADGYGHTRLSRRFRAGQMHALPVLLRPNVASTANGATATGDGLNLDKLIDDTEATNWASLDEPIEGKQVTVRLDPSRPSHVIRRVQVSAMLRPRIEDDPGGDTGGQSRFSALRQFEVWTCTLGPGVDCSEDAHFSKAFTSPEDAFPAVVPRPRSPELIVRSFAIPQTRASHVRLVVLTNQCTGTPGYLGDQDQDPGNDTDCRSGSTQDENVRAAELQVFAR